MKSILISTQKDKDSFWITPSNIDTYDYVIDITKTVISCILV